MLLTNQYRWCFARLWLYFFFLWLASSCKSHCSTAASSANLSPLVTCSSPTLSNVETLSQICHSLYIFAYLIATIQNVCCRPWLRKLWRPFETSYQWIHFIGNVCKFINFMILHYGNLTKLVRYINFCHALMSMSSCSLIIVVMSVWLGCGLLHVSQALRL